jgi:Calcium binding
VKLKEWWVVLRAKLLGRMPPAGWYYYLEEKLKFPFKARCKSKCAVSPLRVGEEATVLGMAPEEDCESEMFVRLKWGGRSMAVPLSRLEPVTADPSTIEAVADWHYWLDRGCKF